MTSLPTVAGASAGSEAAAQVAEEYRAETEPFYLPVGDEVELFEAAYAQRIPVLLKGPTGCGKTRFLEFMSWRLRRPSEPSADGHAGGLALVTIACHEDLSAGDLIGRYLLGTQGTEWLDGPLTRAVTKGSLCYLDEIVEARKDTMVVIHSLTDHRRLLPIPKRGTVLTAHPDFLLVVSYNPGYQSAFKDLKHSTRQRFVAIDFGYPPESLDERIIAHESGVGAAAASRLALLGQRVRNLDAQRLLEGPSTRLLIYAGRLIAQGVLPRRACDVAIVKAMTDDTLLQQGVGEVVRTVFDA